MASNMDRLVLVFLIPAILLLATPLASSSSSPSPTGAELARDAIERAASFFAENEEFRIPRGSMYKHFVNMEHFFRMRTVEGVLPTAADRMQAWEIRCARSSSRRRTRRTNWL